MDHSTHHAEAKHSVFANHKLLTGLAIGAVAAGAAVILAPVVLPALGIGTETMAEDAMFSLHTSVDAGGSGLAGVINRALAGVPVIGTKLAEGGLFNAAAVATIGVGGVLLGNFIARREDGSKRIKWGKLIKYVALATSAVVALPTVLTALTTGIAYLSMFVENPDLGMKILGWADKTLGVAGNMTKTMMGFSGLAAVIPHFLTCGSILIPPALSMLLSDEPAKKEMLQSPYGDGSIVMEVKPREKLVSGKSCDLTITLTHRDSKKPVTPEELAVVHTEKLHLFVVDSSLKDYHHIHPQPTDTPGEYRCELTPTTANQYQAWADITTVSERKNLKLLADIPSPGARRVPPAIRVNDRAEQNGMRFEWKSSEPLQSGKASIVEANISDATGKPVTDLEPVMGAFAHLVGFGADGKSMVHCHPLGKEPSSPDERGGPNLRFHVEPHMSGPTQFYLQIRRGGEDIFVPFGQRIKEPMLAAARASHAHGHSHAFGY